MEGEKNGREEERRGRREGRRKETKRRKWLWLSKQRPQTLLLLGFILQ